MPFDLDLDLFMIIFTYNVCFIVFYFFLLKGIVYYLDISSKTGRLIHLFYATNLLLLS